MVAAAELVPAMTSPSAGAESCWEKHPAPIRHFHRGSSGGAAAEGLMPLLCPGSPLDAKEFPAGKLGGGTN